MLRIETQPVQPLALGLTQKWDEAKHPRGRMGRFVESATISVEGRDIKFIKPKRAYMDTLVMLDVAKVDANLALSPSFYVSPGGKGAAISNRYQRFGEFIATTTDPIETPEIGVTPEGVVGFTNGRHRWAWLRDHGVKAIPVALEKSSIAAARKFGYLVEKVEKQEHKYGNTQIQIPPFSSAAISLNDAREAICDDDTMATGKDVDPNHVTVRYGIQNPNVDALREFIAQQAPFTANVRGVTLFPASEHSDGAVPVVANVESEELRAIEAEIGRYADFKNKNFPDYHPHCTLAYCKPEAAENYADLHVDGTFLVQDITISHASGMKETIAFSGAYKFDPNQPRDAKGQWTKGGPVKVFHTSDDATITKFKRPDGFGGIAGVRGIHFTTREDFGYGSNRYPVELNVKNTLVVDTATLGGKDPYEYMREQLWADNAPNYDSVAIKWSGDGSTEWIIFDPDQATITGPRVPHESLIRKFDPNQPRDARGRFVDLGLHGDQVTVLHGTTRLNAEAILAGGFKPGNPAAVAAQVEQAYGLPKDSILNHAAFGFAKGRIDLDEVHFTTDESVADQYSVPEVMQDALSAAYSLLYPDTGVRIREYNQARKKWLVEAAKRFGEPALLSVTVPFDVVGQHSFGKKLTLQEFQAIQARFPGDTSFFNNIRIPITALAGAKIQRRKWDESKHTRQPKGSSRGGEFSAYHGVKDAIESVLNGETVNIDRDNVRRFVERTAEQVETVNLTHVNVEGMKIFGGEGLGIKREEMPQIPKEHRANFLKEMKARGITVTEEMVDPLSLKPTQNEISAQNVAEKLIKYEQRGKTFPPVLVSNDNRILDGHHHWGIMAVVASEAPTAVMPIYRLNVNVRRALAEMHAYDKRHSLKRKSISQKWDESQHPRDEDGKFSTTLFHGSDAENLASILENNLRVGTYSGLYGKGIYATPNFWHAKTFGTEVVQVRLKPGVKVKAFASEQEYYTFLNASKEARLSVSKALEAQGFGAHSVKTKLGIDYIVIHDPKHLGKVSVAVAKSDDVYYLVEVPTMKPVKKLDASTGRYVTPFVSFDQQGEKQLQLIASLNSSRLATWGFTAEAEVRGMARYRITAVLDGRTSEFCRMISGKIFEVEDARRKVIEVLSVQNPEDLKVVQPWPKQTKAAIAEFEEMSADELTALGFHIPPYHPYCRTICRPVESSIGEEMEEVATIPTDAETFQPVTAADLKELGVEATPENVAQWNEHIGMTPVELLSKFSSLPPQEVMTKPLGVGANPIRFADGNIDFKVNGETPKGVEFKLQAILDPFTGIFYLNQAQLLAGTPMAEIQFMKNLFSSLIEMGLKSSAKSIAVGVAGNAAYYAKLGFLPDELEWDSLRKFALEGNSVIPEVLASLAPLDRILIEQLLQDKSVSAMTALVELPFRYKGKTIGEWLFGEATGTWALDLTDEALVLQAMEYLL